TDGTDGTDTSDTTGEPDEPHAQGMIVLSESHPSAGGSSTPAVSASFVPNSDNTGGSGGCFEQVEGCQLALVPDCGDGCNSDEYCTFNESCSSTCSRICDASCAEDEVCYFPAPDSPGCKKIESFDAGALTFIGTPLPINLFPPYAFNGDSGSPFASGGEASVQASGATNAGFEAFEASFTGTSYIQTSPSLSQLTIPEIFGDSALPIGWQPGNDDVLISVLVTSNDFTTSHFTCEAVDSDGSFQVPRAAIEAALDGEDLSSMTISVQRKKVDRTKGLTTKGTLTGVTVESVGWVDVVTQSMESHYFEGCDPGESYCGSGCVDVQYDTNNCGGCGQVCDGECYDGVCNSQESCDACTAEVKTGACQSEQNTCQSNSDCTAYEACIDQCEAEDWDCFDSCYEMHSEGEEDLFPLLECICGTCSPHCSAIGYCL
ncbi:MAG: hypothetical protein ACPG4T_14985, partial [Nannocystaceae bacterium]